MHVSLYLIQKYNTFDNNSNNMIQIQNIIYTIKSLLKCNKIINNIFDSNNNKININNNENNSNSNINNNDNNKNDDPRLKHTYSNK